MSLRAVAGTLLLCAHATWRHVSANLHLPTDPLTNQGCDIYEGIVGHQRTYPVKHSFQYRVRCALVDLDRPPPWFERSSGRRHMAAAEARQLAGTAGAVRLLTNPASLGYDQNPISVYYCYDGAPGGGALRRCIAEVTNTPWGERVVFTFEPEGDALPKPLHVSPFMDMASTWRFSAPPPGERLRLSIAVSHPEHGDFFRATLHAREVAAAGRPPPDPEWQLWLMPHKVAFWIYYQAFLLWWKGVPLFQHPKYSAGRAYQEAVLVRNAKDRPSYKSNGRSSATLRESGGQSSSAAGGMKQGRADGGGCPFRWYEAAGWPWR